MFILNLKKIASSFLLPPLLMALIFVSPALEASPNLSGTWSGIVTDKSGEDIKAVLEVESDKSNNSYQYLLSYKSPRTCRIKAEELSAEKDSLILKFYETNGGFCDKLYKGKMSIIIDSSKQLSVLIESKSKKISESATLKKQ